MFNNTQPIYYDSDIKPPSGGLCIHRPIQPINEDDRKQSHCEFLTFARNIILQAPTSRQIIQTHSQYSNQNLASFSYQRIEYLFNEMVKTYDDIENQKLQSKQDDSLSGRKRKAPEVDKPTSSDTIIFANTTTAAPPPNQLNDVSENKNPSQHLNKRIQSNQHVDQQSKVSTVSNVDNKMQKRPHCDIALGLEDDEQFLEYLQQGHNGNIERAKFYMLSQLSQGRGEMSNVIYLSLMLQILF